MTGLIVPGSSGGASSYLGQVGTGCFMPRNIITGTNTYNRSRDPVITTEKVVNPRVGWARWRVASGIESAPASDGTICAVLEYPAGIFTVSNQNIAAGGANSPVPMPTNAVTFLDFNVTIPAFATVYLWVIQASASGGVLFRQGQHYLGARPLATMNNGTGTPPDILAAFATAQSEYSYPPILFLGQTVRPSVLMLADSREDAGEEVCSGPFYNIGPMLRAIGKQYGYTSCAESGSSLTAFVNGTSANRANRVALAPYFSHVVNGWNVNDLNQGRTVAQLLADRATFATFFPNNVVVGATCQPYTPSTDGWSTTANQGLGTRQPQIRQLNRAIRAGIAGEAFYLDVARATQPNNDNAWPVAPDPSSVGAAPITITGSIPANSTVLTVTATSGTLTYGMTLTDSLDGQNPGYTSLPFPGTMILEQLTGTTGSTGTYTVTPANPTAVPSKTMYAGAAYGTKDGLHGNHLVNEQAAVRMAPDMALFRRAA